MLVLTDVSADFKFEFGGPAAPTLVSYVVKSAASTTLATNTKEAYNSPVSVLATASTRPIIVEVDGIIENGANAGDLAFRWAQNTSFAADTQVLKGSYIEYAEVA